MIILFVLKVPVLSGGTDPGVRGFILFFELCEAEYSSQSRGGVLPTSSYIFLGTRYLTFCQVLLKQKGTYRYIYGGSKSRHSLSS